MLLLVLCTDNGRRRRAVVGSTGHRRWQKRVWIRAAAAKTILDTNDGELTSGDAIYTFDSGRRQTAMDWHVGWRSWRCNESARPDGGGTLYRILPPRTVADVRAMRWAKDDVQRSVNGNRPVNIRLRKKYFTKMCKNNVRILEVNNPVQKFGNTL